MESSGTPSIFPLPLKNFFGYRKFKNALTGLASEAKESNCEMIDQEIEATQSILNEQELFLHTAEVLSPSDPAEGAAIHRVVKLSLVPQCSTPIFIVGDNKTVTPLRTLPALELFLAFPVSYPSKSGLLTFVANSTKSNFLFYEPVRTFLYERLGEKWQEDLLSLYACIDFIQTELMD